MMDKESIDLQKYWGFLSNENDTWNESKKNKGMDKHFFSDSFLILDEIE